LTLKIKDLELPTPAQPPRVEFNQHAEIASGFQ